MDESLRFREHVENKVGRAYGAFRILYPHRSYLPIYTKKLLCESLVLSKFNYCSPVYRFCLDQDSLGRIQQVENNCIRFIFGIRKFEHVSHKLVELSWLPMRLRFNYHALCTFHKLVVKRRPPYLFNKLQYRADVHNVNIRHRNLLTCPHHRTSTFQRSLRYTTYVNCTML